MPPLIIAHRGASADAPENTLRAFALAIEQGARMIELDLHATRDGHVVASHDETLVGSSRKKYCAKMASGAAIHVRRFRPIMGMSLPLYFKK